MALLKQIKAKMRDWYGSLDVEELVTNEELKKGIENFELEIARSEKKLKKDDLSGLASAVESCFRAVGIRTRGPICLKTFVASPVGF